VCVCRERESAMSNCNAFLTCY